MGEQMSVPYFIVAQNMIMAMAEKRMREIPLTEAEVMGEQAAVEYLNQHTRLLTTEYKIKQKMMDEGLYTVQNGMIVLGNMEGKSIHEI